MAVNNILGNTIIKSWQLVLDFDPPLIRGKVLIEICVVVYKSTKRMSTMLLPSNMDPTSISRTYTYLLNSVRSEEPKLAVQPIVDVSWG